MIRGISPITAFVGQLQVNVAVHGTQAISLAPFEKLLSGVSCRSSRGM
jgi:hypothetical protein